MSYKIKNLYVKNFKCFDNKKFYKFEFEPDANPTILSGPNGFGKTTFFDAIELVFTGKITRMQLNIESKSTNLNKNILLNTSEEFGYIVLILKNEDNSYVTIVASINNSYKKIDIKNSIKYAVLKYYLDIQKFDEIVSNTMIWKDNIDEFKFNKEHFNVYYYISQAESVSFLKKNISDRKNSINGMLKLENVDKKIEKITSKLIGKNTQNKDVLINKEIHSLEEKIQEKATKISKYNSEISNENIEFEKLLNYPEDAELKKWDDDTEKMDVLSLYKKDEYIKEIRGLSLLYKNLSDYKQYLENQKIKQILNNAETINDFINIYRFFTSDEINKDLVIDYIKKETQKNSIYKYSKFFRTKLDLEEYNKDNNIKLKNIGGIEFKFNVDEIDSTVIQINKISKVLSELQQKKEKINTARINLHELAKTDREITTCPYCNYDYQNAELLEEAYNSLGIQIENSKATEARQVDELKEKLKELTIEDTELINSILGDMTDESVLKSQEELLQLERILKDENKIQDLMKIKKIIKDDSLWHDLDNKMKIVEIKGIMAASTTEYKDADFDKLLTEYDFVKLYDSHETILHLKQDKLLDSKAVDSKIAYVENKFVVAQNEEYMNERKELRSVLTRKKKLENLRKQFDNLKKVYESSINDYKNSIIKKLRLPLLIYTGKILQDYQNGLGVFINRDEMRFVFNIDSKLDILNTFSSGQLSGFILSFLFAMNKQYIVEDNDDIGFVLIDDPVQTMDDINIASFIEVLRNDFPNKQIILSTHETDKENYILYKFLKYNLKGRSFNVKEKLY